jgi:hypothetical protein
MNKPTNSEIVPGLLLNHVTLGEVLVMVAPVKGFVGVKRFVGEAQIASRVKARDLRWQ